MSSRPFLPLLIKYSFRGRLTLKEWMDIITMHQKQEIILKYFREGKIQREIHRETGIARDTVKDIYMNLIGDL